MLSRSTENSYHSFANLLKHTSALRQNFQVVAWTMTIFNTYRCSIILSRYNSSLVMGCSNSLILWIWKQNEKSYVWKRKRKQCITICRRKLVCMYYRHLLYVSIRWIAIHAACNDLIYVYKPNMLVSQNNVKWNLQKKLNATNFDKEVKLSMQNYNYQMNVNIKWQKKTTKGVCWELSKLLAACFTIIHQLCCLPTTPTKMTDVPCIKITKAGEPTVVYYTLTVTFHRLY